MSISKRDSKVLPSRYVRGFFSLILKISGEFRRVHVMQHSHAEAIAMYHGDQVEKRLSSRAFDKVVDNSVTIVKWEWFLTCTYDLLFTVVDCLTFSLVLSYLFSYLGTLMGYVVIALPLIFNWSKALENNYVTTGTPLRLKMPLS